MNQNKLWKPETERPITSWVCLWQDETGKYIVNEDFEYLSAQSSWRNPHVEELMRAEARSFGIDGGKPVWKPGRKITQTEHEIQMERLADGKIPDELDAIAAAEDELKRQ